MTANKILFLVIDGVSDRPCPELRGLTPLAAAKKPVLDKLAAEGVCGIMDTISPGIRPGSDTAHLSLLGYDPHTYYTGRGPLECEGSGIHMEPGMIGFRCNFATLSPQGLITDRRAGRIHDTQALSEAIRKEVDLSGFRVEFDFRSGAGHRAALALKGKGLGHCVTSNDPKKEGVPPLKVKELRQTQADQKTADICNEFVKQSSEILFRHPVNVERVNKGLNPANIVLMRGAGEMGDLPPFEKKYGLKGSVISAASLITGIGTAVGLEHIPVEGITGSQNSNIKGKIRAALAELRSKDFVLVNIKGADESGHDGLPLQKKAFIEKIDEEFEPLLALKGTIIVICADHSTPCCIKDHSADPVPVIIRGEGVRTDDVVRFDEYSCAKGGLCRIHGCDLMPIALDLINRAHKFGA
ncbi:MULTISPECIES: 2,3-bisphosphoglycerate-independent phosphoglycerate mutase [unclassified Methanoregula]|uniref:2,3-bisphosphoglycerate-independent phosphoglycerate mutase n=1 Tax=unclassified Methanoregula TaxID=2649730 RepID=UPI0009C87387|nr:MULTISPECIES: 2,3-bisphosphoglycerate-independent phosphoglycerate mutase [unclassified Methanoregula]OPX64074.1 MAG: 2,3-bisphosphoglycerate-independent phosphoglycerate mutase 1 [Methanoregula sp. PtaB.Bin085]OPY33728.1 MAG: 2,3-bisphosphoglycerate-independent phosphoglycerate mutase 1 [Methanoregula sp. PtaU1.Bin006]